jgi:carboxypeptidase C (cathepsin A)
VGVGFSLSLDGKLSTTDAAVADDNVLILQTFLDRFKHLRANDLYLSGESYAGASGWGGVEGRGG